MELDYAFMVRTFGILLQAIPVTLKLTAVTLVLATPFAFLLALARIYTVPYVAKFASVYVSVMRGIPMVLQILLVYSLLPSLLNYLFKRAGIAYNIFDLDTIWYAYIIFTLGEIAVLSEVFRSALGSVGDGQIEAGLSVGMNRRTIYRRILIPQALVRAMPSLCNVTVTLLKNTSLAFMMAVQDITATGKIAASYGYNYVEAYLDVFLVYIIVCSLVQIAFRISEKHLGRFRHASQTSG